jgi:hypothetical protein
LDEFAANVDVIGQVGQDEPERELLVEPGCRRELGRVALLLLDVLEMDVAIV